MTGDRDALFTALALRMGFLQADRLTGIYSAWQSSSMPLPEFLVDKRVVTEEQRRLVEDQLSQLESRHCGDQSSLWAEVADEQVRSLMTSLGHENFNPTVDMPSTGGGGRSESSGFDLTVGQDEPRISSAGSFVEATIDSRGGEHSHRFEHVESLPVSGESTTLKYARTSLHAQGGVGQIWVARDATLGREVALKELRPEQIGNSIVRSRFLDEARITGQLEHPGIVPIYELARHPDDGRPFYTMRFVRGRTLSRAIRDYHERRASGEAGPLEFRSLLDSLIAVCNAIAYAHARGIIHRDLKGQNVMLGDFGEVLVLDWGLAKPIAVTAGPEPGHREPRANGSQKPNLPPAIVDAPTIEFDADRNETMQGQVLGTPSYMSPEQAEGKIDRIGPRSDVYSLGAILYEILCGQRPFAGSKTSELLRLVRQQMPEAPRKVMPSAPIALEAVCLKAMARMQEDRYATAGELADELRRFLADEPVLVYREPWVIRAGRWARRHRSAVVAAAAIAGVGLPALAIGNVLVGQQRDRARALEGVARTAVNDFYVGAAGDWLDDRSDPQQEVLLERAVTFFEGPAQAENKPSDDGDPGVALALIAESRPTPEQSKAAEASADYYLRFADDPASARAESAEALVRVGDLRRRLGEFDSAEAAYGRAIERVAIAKENPDASVAGAKALAHRGALQAAVGKSEAAETDLRAALTELERAAGFAPAEHLNETKVEQAATELDLADLYKVLGRSKESEKQYLSAIERLEPIVEADANDIRASRTLALANDGLGVLLMLQQRGSEAEPRLLRATDLLEPLVQRSPMIARNREALAKTCNSLGLVQRRMGRTVEAEKHLSRALSLYERLAEDFPGRYEYRRALARGHTNLAYLLRDDGRAPLAASHFATAAKEYEALSKSVPDVPKIRRDLAYTLIDLGHLAITGGQLEEAVEPLERAVLVSQSLIKTNPGIPDYELALATALLDQGVLRRQLGDGKASQEALEESARRYDALVAAHPDRPSYAHELAQCMNALGLTLAQLEAREPAESRFRRAIEIYGKCVDQDAVAVRAGLAESLTNIATLEPPPADAVEAQEKALALFSKLQDDHPTDRWFKQSASVAQFNIGDRLLKSGKASEAEPYLVTAAEGLTSLIPEEEPTPTLDPAAHYLAALALTKLGELRGANRPAEAVATLERAVKHARSATRASANQSYLKAARDAVDNLVAALVANGQTEDAIKAATALPEAAPRKPELRVDAAKLLARLIPPIGASATDDANLVAARRAIGDRAVAQLRVAIDSGYPLPNLGESPEFDPLRDREDFRAIVEDAKASPAASE
jgi:eukaryotic-like serine/threonine-protein kinase